MGVKCKYKTLSEHGFLYVVDEHFEDYQTLPIFFQAKTYIFTTVKVVLNSNYIRIL